MKQMELKLVQPQVGAFKPCRLGWQKPYEVRIRHRGFFNWKLAVYFEEDVLIAAGLDEEEAYRLAHILNTAYNLGRASIEAERARVEG